MSWVFSHKIAQFLYPLHRNVGSPTSFKTTQYLKSLNNSMIPADSESGVQLFLIVFNSKTQNLCSKQQIDRRSVARQKSSNSCGDGVFKT